MWKLISLKSGFFFLSFRLTGLRHVHGGKSLCWPGGGAKYYWFHIGFILQTCYCFIHLCELSRSVLTLTCACITHFDPRSWRNKPGFVRFIPALRGTETLSPLFLFTPFSFVSQSSSSGNPSLHGSMSSSADFSDEDDYSLKSGSASPAPGDTLPWNLPRHERSKRKIHGGSVLDPAERAVLRIAGEQLRPGCSVFTYTNKIWPTWSFLLWIFSAAHHSTSSYCDWVCVVPCQLLCIDFGKPMWWHFGAHWFWIWCRKCKCNVARMQCSLSEKGLFTLFWMANVLWEAGVMK